MKAGALIKAVTFQRPENNDRKDALCAKWMSHQEEDNRSIRDRQPVRQSHEYRDTEREV